MKLKPFIQFVEKNKVDAVLHHSDPALSGHLISVDWDDKKVTIEKNSGGRRVMKLTPFLEHYQLVIQDQEVRGKGRFVRMHDNGNFKVGQEVIYSNDKANHGYNFAVGKVVGSTNKFVSVCWSNGATNGYTREFAADHIFVRVFTQEELNMKAYAKTIEELAKPTEPAKLFKYYIIRPDTRVVVDVVEAHDVEGAREAIAPAFKAVFGDNMIVAQA